MLTVNSWRRILARLEREFDDDDRTIIERARNYVDNRVYRAELVNSLPSSAPAGYLMVTPGDTHLYIGAGMANPLRRIPTQAV